MRLHVAEGIVEHLDRIGLGPAFDALQRAVDDRFRDRLLAVQHQTIHELCEDAVAILGIRQNLALLRATTTRHLSGSPYFGRFAPYFDRRCRRSFTPWVSSEPRMM